MPGVREKNTGMDQQHRLLTYPTWERYTVLSTCIHRLSIRDRRRLFHYARVFDGDCSNVFFPEFGFTLSEFAVWYTIGDPRRREAARG